MRTQRDIFALGFFQDVTVDYEPTGDSADIRLKLRVQEKQTGTASAGAGYSSQSGLTGFIDLGHNNLLRQRQAINLHLERGSKQGNIQISFTDPWFRDTPLTLGFDIFNMRRNYDFYNRRDVGGGIRLGRPLGWPDYTRGSSATSCVTSRWRTSGATARGSGRAGVAAATQWPRRSSSVGVTFSRVSTDTPSTRPAAPGSPGRTPSPGASRGRRDLLQGDGGDPGILRLSGPFVMMLRQKAGFLGGPTVPEYELFRLGGTNADYLRGYPDYYVVPRANITRNPVTGAVIDRYPGGKLMAILTSEIQFRSPIPSAAWCSSKGGTPGTDGATSTWGPPEVRRGGYADGGAGAGRIGLDVGYGSTGRKDPGGRPTSSSATHSEKRG